MHAARSSQCGIESAWLILSDCQSGGVVGFEFVQTRITSAQKQLKTVLLVASDSY